ncbi:protein of unknown function [Aminobacter niigataensis]|nr:protein of unknown function [Aminobacter niigataensis]
MPSLPPVTSTFHYPFNRLKKTLSAAEKRFNFTGRWANTGALRGQPCPARTMRGKNHDAIGTIS